MRRTNPLLALPLTAAALGVLTTSLLAGDQTPPEEVNIRVPADLDPNEPAPLLILLHGYGISGTSQEFWWRLWPEAEANGFLFAAPTGSTDSNGKTYWNANHNCCDFDDANVDHVSYLLQLIESIRSNHNVDPQRIHLVGYSNGGCMAYRMACEHGDLLASVVSVAGSTWLDPANCPSDDPVHVLHIHGTNDQQVSYEGGFDPSNPPNPHPGATGTIAQWVQNNGCHPDATESPKPFNLDQQVTGPETYVTRFDAGCTPNGSATLWRIQGGTHFVNLSNLGRERIIQFLVDHSSTARCPADLDASSRVDAADLGLLIAVWNTNDAQADLDGSGTVDSADLGLLIAAWGPCP